MDSQDRYSDAKIDNILSELRGQNADGLNEPDEQALDSILAELGLTGEAPRQRSLELYNEMQKGAAPKQAPPIKTGAAKKEAAEKEESQPEKPAPKAPAAPPPRYVAEVAEEDGAPSIMNVKLADREAGGTPAMRRMGKASALAKVRPGKFEDDEELKSWFTSSPQEEEDEDLPPAPRRPQRGAAHGKGKKGRQKQEETSEALFEDEMPEGRGEPAHTPPEKAHPEPQLPPRPVGLGGRGAKPAPPAPRAEEPAGAPPTAAERQDPDEAMFQTWQGPSFAGVRGQDDETWQASLEEEERVMPDITNDTKIYEADPQADRRVPTAAYTQKYDPATGEKITQLPEDEIQARFIDEKVDDRFVSFFKETVVETEPEPEAPRRRKKKRRSSTGEFAQLEKKVEKISNQFDEGEDGEDADDYNHLRDAEAIQAEIYALKKSLWTRAGLSALLALALLWMALGMAGVWPLPKFLSPPETNLLAAGLYAALVAAGIAVNYKTMLAGLAGLFTEATIETPPALGLLAALGQAGALVYAVAAKQPLAGTLFGCVIMGVLAVHSIGKALQTDSILKNFEFTSSGRNYAAAYVLSGRHQLAHTITAGLEENEPALLVSRQTTLMKKFMRQSFSQRLSDRTAKILGWCLLALAAVTGAVVYLVSKNWFTTLAAVAAVFSFGTPVSSSLSSAVPAVLLQKNTAKAGAVVPGWSAMDALGRVNVLMAESGDLFPPEAVQLQKVNIYEDSIDTAIRYAASVLVEGCDTLREAFLDTVDHKEELLYPVEDLVCEPGRGFTAWTNDARVVIGSREMMQRNGITPPPVEDEMAQLPEGCVPLYMAVSGRLLAMFAVEYRPDVEVDEVLGGLVRSGVSLLVTSYDVNVTAEMIEEIYRLPPNMVKVLARKELEALEPLTAYLPESEGVMAHLGGFGCLIAGIRAASGASTAEKMAGFLQIGAVALAAILCLVLALDGTLATLSLLPILLYQLAWGVLVAGVPFTRQYAV